MTVSKGGASGGAELELADWRRRVARLYADVRFLYPDDAVAAWQLWRTEREKLYQEHRSRPSRRSNEPPSGPITGATIRGWRSS